MQTHKVSLWKTKSQEESIGSRRMNWTNKNWLAQIKNEEAQVKVNHYWSIKRWCLFIISVEEVILYTSNSSIDWVLESKEYQHVTPHKKSLLQMKSSFMLENIWEIITIILLEWEMSKSIWRMDLWSCWNILGIF